MPFFPLRIRVLFFLINIFLTSLLLLILYQKSLFYQLKRLTFRFYHLGILSQKKKRRLSTCVPSLINSVKSNGPSIHDTSAEINNRNVTMFNSYINIWRFRYTVTNLYLVYLSFNSPHIRIST